jgi:hypothetical protein
VPKPAKIITDIKSIARTHTHTALKTLVSIAACSKAPHSARVTAAVALLDRGWGKPAQFMELSGEVAIERIERVIVDEQGLQTVDTTADVVNETDIPGGKPTIQ